MPNAQSLGPRLTTACHRRRHDGRNLSCAERMRGVPEQEQSCPLSGPTINPQDIRAVSWYRPRSNEH
jgi:hypothetical protein